MKRVGIFFSAPEFDDQPFTSPDYRTAYRHLASIIEDFGGACVIVRGAETFLGAGQFRHGWEWENGAFRFQQSPVSVDVLFNKGEAFQADTATTMINPAALDALCRNKDRTVELFPDLFPHTIVVRSQEELPAALSQLTGNIVVSKPTDAWGGKGVAVLPRAEMAEHISGFPVLLQEFIDTRSGITGITAGMHDLRMLMVGGQLTAAHVRTPPDGRMVANIAQGGTMSLLEPDLVPAGARAIAQIVDDTFASFGPRIISVDVGLHEGRIWKMFEVNPQPGILFPHRGESVIRHHRAIARLLLS